MKRKRHWSYTGEKRRLAILRRDNHECQIRGPGCLGVADTVDHIHPKAWGGGENPENLRAACKVCNMRKGAHAGGGASAAPTLSFFRGASHSRAPLPNLPPRTRWSVIRAD